MNLKTFHVIFITAAILLTAFFGYWAYQNYSTTNSKGYLVTAVISWMLSLALAIYEFKFYKRTKVL